jgi:hypothetical protein
LDGSVKQPGTVISYSAKPVCAKKDNCPQVF